MSLTARQEKAARHLASGDSNAVVASKVGVSRVSVHKWLKKPEFKEKVEKLKAKLSEKADEVYCEVVRERAYEIVGKEELLSIFSEIVRDKDVRIANRIKAGMALAKWHGMEGERTAIEDNNPFPLQELLDSGGSAPLELNQLSDEQLDALYLNSLADSC